MGGKLLLRLSIVGIAIYLIVCYGVYLFCGLEILDDTYVIALELCLCLCISAQGKYHCKFIRWTAYSILLSDTLQIADNYLSFVPPNITAYIFLSIIPAGLLTTTTLAVIHYVKVKKLKRQYSRLYADNIAGRN